MPRRSPRHAFTWNAVAQAATALSQLAVTLALVRVLDAEAFGRVAMVYLVAGLLAVLDEGSLATRLMSTREDAPDRLSAVLYLESLLGLALALLAALAAPVLGYAFEQPDLPRFLLPLAPLFAVSGPKRFYQTLFQRELAFGEIARVRVLAAVLFVGVTVGCAVGGLGVWSLVTGLVVRVATESVGICAYGLREFVPRRPSFEALRSGYGRPGLAKVGERFLSYLVERVDLLIIGKALGPGALGVYDVFRRFSLGLYQQVVPLFTRVAMPRFALLTDDPPVLAKAYTRELRTVCTLLFPAYLLQACYAEPIVRLVFGGEWVAYAAVFSWISLLLLVRTVSIPVDALLMARGFVKREFVYSACLVSLLAATLLYVVHDGLLAAVVAITWLHLALTVPTYWWVVRPASSVRTAALLRAIGWPLALSVLTIGGSYLALRLALRQNPGTVLASAGTGVAVYAAVVAWRASSSHIRAEAYAKR